MSAVAVINIGQLAPVSAAPILDAAILIRDGRFTAVGARAEVEPLIPTHASVVDAGRRVVTPGFVDAHTHPVFAGNRAAEYELRAQGLGYEDIARQGGGIRSTVRATRAATDDELVTASRRYTDWFLRCGTTTVEAKTGYGLTVADELKMLRAIRTLDATTPLRYIPTFLGAHIVPGECSREEYVALVIEGMLPHADAEFCDVYCDRGAFTPAEAEQILLAARARGLGLRMHADQLADTGGAALAARLRTKTADHLEHTTTAGITAMKEAGVQPVLLPGSVYALGSSRYPAAREMIDAGLDVVLATDFNPGTSPTPSIPMVLSLAVTHMKMTPAEALRAATLSAARSLNRAHELGAIEPGKIADFVIHDCADYRELAYFFGVEQTHATYAAGRPVYIRADQRRS